MAALTQRYRRGLTQRAEYGSNPFVGALPPRGTLRKLHHLVVIFGHRLRIVREFGEAPFEALKSTRLVGAIRCPGQFGICARFGAILLSCEHRPAFLREGLPPTGKYTTSLNADSG